MWIHKGNQFPIFPESTDRQELENKPSKMFIKSAAVLLFAAYFATSADAFGDAVWSNLSATWKTTGNSGPYNLPTSLQQALDEGWTIIEGAEPSDDIIDALNSIDDLDPLTVEIIESLGYETNPRYVIHFNGYGEPAGVQLGIPAIYVDDSGIPIDYKNHPAIVYKILNGVGYYTGTFFFAIDVNGNRRMWNVDSGGLLEIPTTAAGMENTNYEKKNCVATMGTHYYQLNTTASCADFYPWVPLLNGDDLLGIAFQAITNTSSDSTRSWNENIPYYGVTVACTDAPTCMPELVEKYGIVSMHTWFTANSTGIACA